MRIAKPALSYSEIFKIGCLHGRLPARLVFTGPEFHCILVIENMSVAGVAIQSATGSLSDISELLHHGGDMGAADIAARSPAVADAVEEIVDVNGVALESPAFAFRCIVGDVFDFPAIFSVNAVGIAAINRDRAFFAVETDAETASHRTETVAGKSFPSDLFAFLVFPADHLRVGCFPVVVMVQTSAGGSYAGRIIDLETPAGKVDRVDRVVSGLAGSPVPEPVPIVVKNVILVRTARGWTLPKFVIEPLGDGDFLADTDRWTGIGIPAAGVKNFADRAALHPLDRFPNPRPGTALIADLDDTVVFFGGFDQKFAFARTVAARLFNVNVFAGFQGKNRHRCVPMVGRGDHDGIDIGIFEDFSKIAFGLRLLALGFGVEGNRPLHRTRIDVAYVSDLAARNAGKDVPDRASAGIYADGGCPDQITRSIAGFERTELAHESESETGDCSLFNKMTATDR